MRASAEILDEVHTKLAQTVEELDLSIREMVESTHDSEESS